MEHGGEDSYNACFGINQRGSIVFSGILADDMKTKVNMDQYSI